MIDVEKNGYEERPVPTIWRPTICEIVDAFREGDFELERRIPNVASLPKADAERIDKTIKYFGSTLLPLPIDTWKTSTYIWMENHWEMLVDLYTVRDGRSDLALFVQVSESRGSYRFNVDSVHVP